MIFTPAQNTSNLLLHCSKNIGKIAISILRLRQKYRINLANCHLARSRRIQRVTEVMDSATPLRSAQTEKMLSRACARLRCAALAKQGYRYRNRNRKNSFQHKLVISAPVMSNYGLLNPPKIICAIFKITRALLS